MLINLSFTIQSVFRYLTTYINNMFAGAFDEKRDMSPLPVTQPMAQPSQSKYTPV